MAVDLSDLAPVLKRTVNPPGADTFPDATTSEWVARLADAFWDARMNGFFVGYHEDEGVVYFTADDPEITTNDLPRELQQVIVLYAAYRTARWQLLNMRTAIRQKAGPVSQEVERSANLLVELLKEFSRELERIRTELSDTAQSSYAAVAFIDMIQARHEQYVAGGEFTL